MLRKKQYGIKVCFHAARHNNSYQRKTKTASGSNCRDWRICEAGKKFLAKAKQNSKTSCKFNLSAQLDTVLIVFTIVFSNSEGTHTFGLFVS